MIVYISVSNLNDRLSQASWSSFWDRMDSAIARYAASNPQQWLSVPYDPYQSACWEVEVHNLERANSLVQRLADLARDYDPIQIIWAPAIRTDIEPSEGQDAEDQRVAGAVPLASPGTDTGSGPGT
jgi:hypothetical protein